MRNARFYLIIISAFLSAAISSCERISSALEEQEPEYVNVKLSMGGELNVEYAPMTKTRGVDGMWGVQVYRTTRTGNRSPYAFGVFTVCPEDLTLIKGNTYEIVVDYLVDADYYTIAGTNNKEDVCLEIPFNTYFWSSYNINEFTYTSDDHIYCLGTTIYEVGLGIDRHYSLEGSSRNNTYDRYYGKCLDFSPDEGGTAVVNMLHMSSSLTVIVKTEDNTKVEGDLILYFSNLHNNGKTFRFEEQGDGTYIASIPVFTIENCEAAYRNYEGYSSAEKLVSLCIGNATDRRYYYGGEISVERDSRIKVTYTLHKVDSATKGMSFTYEDDEMKDLEIAL